MLRPSPFASAFSAPIASVIGPVSGRNLASVVGLALVFGLTLFCSSACGETWTSLRGNHTIEAKMLGLWNDNVVLERPGGERVVVPLRMLRSDSRIRAQELAETLKGARTEHIEELRTQAEAAAAPAPNPLPQPPAAPAYNPPQPGDDAAAFLIQIDDAVRDGHLRAIYDALPPKHREDVDSLVKLAADNIKPQTWGMITGTVYDIGDLLVTRQNWLMSSPRIANLPPDLQSQIEYTILPLANVLREGFHPDAMQLEKLQSMPFSQWLEERDEAMAPYLAKLFSNSMTSPQQIRVESQQQGTAIVVFGDGPAASKSTYVSIDGYWLPKVMADGWQQRVEAWNSMLSSGAPLLDAVAMQLVAVRAKVQSLASAQDAAQFHLTMESMIAEAQPQVMALAARFGATPNQTSQNRRGGGFAGEGEMMMEEDLYADEMEGMGEMEEMEMEMEMMEGMEMEGMQDAGEMEEMDPR